MIKYIFKKKYKYVIAIAIFSIICAALTLLLPDIQANIISIGIGKSNIEFIYECGIKLVIISVFIAISSIIASYFSNKMGAKIGFELRKRLYERTINLDESDINNYGVSSLIVRNTNDINQIQNMISLFFKTIIYTIILGIGGIFKAITKSQNITSLSLIVILSILFVAIVLFIIFIIVIPRYTALQTKLDKINKRMQEVLQGILFIKVFNQENIEEHKSKKFNKEYSDLEYYLNKIMSLLNPFVTLILNLCTLAIIYIIFKKALTLTELANMLAFSEYATQVITSFLSLAICFILLPKAYVSYNRITEVINTYNTIYDNNNSQDIRNINKLEFKNVSFKYPKSQINALTNINFIVNKGETIAIIGPTGSGKTTIVNLLNRFYDVDEGAILLNDIDLRNIKLKTINQKIATVFQNDFIMRSTIKESLFEDDDNIINQALNNACIPELINNLNKKISFEGTNLSGGQKQRLLIARSLLKNPDILIFDDALSAVDYKTEKTILNNIRKKYPELIKVIITSRISSLKNVDKIIVINNGEIIGFANHQTLLKNCPTYKEFIKIAKEDNINE